MSTFVVADRPAACPLRGSEVNAVGVGRDGNRIAGCWIRDGEIEVVTYTNAGRLSAEDATPNKETDH